MLQVPFLDILTSMLDPSLPLTIQEYEEWGEPGSNESDFHYIRSYCPYQNIKNQVKFILLLMVLSEKHTQVYTCEKFEQVWYNVLSMVM